MRVFAPAKVNLYLHITKRLRNGYHALDSLVMFADIGDDIEITPSEEFEFIIAGPFAGSLRGADSDSGPKSKNLAVKAVWRMAQLFDRTPNVTLRLTKNLPLGAGIGGGSSDAAAVIWGLCSLWDIDHNDERICDLLISLGADVPICFAAISARIKGIGDVFEPVDGLPELSVVLAHPSKSCGTIDVFRAFEGDFRELVALPPALKNRDDLMQLLRRCDNDLLGAAMRVVPEIENVLQAIYGQENCYLARMSGSGSCCFGVFANENDAANAAESLREANPDWWVMPASLGRVRRY